MPTPRLVRCSLGLIVLALAPPGGAQAPPNPNAEATQKDHQAMMDLLKIDKLRPGKNGSNPQDPNFANYDEAKANPFPNLPDPLVLQNGKKVTTAAMWWNLRRPEIVEDFDREVYGRVPKNVPKVNWRVISLARDTNNGIPIITRQLLGVVDNSAHPSITVEIQVSLTVPANAKGPVPVIMQFGFAPGFGRGGFGMMGMPGRGPAGAAPGRGAMPGAAGRGGPGGRGPTGPGWQQQVLAKGWGYAIISPNSIQQDTPMP
ncbi:MAG: acetylxylan esterase, partial [Acidobacteriia bacterium]|nr:acetylxylan esterase [Terriglobia bacterium]